MSRSRLAVHAGAPYPLGATPDAKGVNFALFSACSTVTADRRPLGSGFQS